MKAVAVALMVAVTAGTAGAYSFTEVDVTAWAESSPSATQEALCILNFPDGTNMAFGYRFDPADTVARPDNLYSQTYGATVQADQAEAMLLSLDAQTGLGVDYSYHYATPPAPSYGFYVKGFSYPGVPDLIGDYAGEGSYVGYWLSGLGAAGDGETWEYAQVGAGDRQLSDGVWDGWVKEFSFPAQDEPVVPLRDNNGTGSDVPEPATMILFGVSLAGLVPALRRRR